MELSDAGAAPVDLKNRIDVNVPHESRKKTRLFSETSHEQMRDEA